jgi:NAD(P)-dependent dehydrogenase (short-subunit alcohol dehydrogenase family)
MTRQNAVILGASGGIGRALTALIAGQGRFASVHALSRSPIAVPDGVTWHHADITDEASLAEAAAAIGEPGDVSLVIVASGLLHAEAIAPEKTLKSLDPEVMARVFATNTVGPALAAKHLLPLLPRRGRSVFAVLSARVGSIGDNRLGGWYSYRASKAALNQIVRTLAIEVKRTRPESVLLALHPGTVTTPLSEPFRGNEPGPGLFSPEQSAEHLLRVIEGATPEQSGGFLAWDGSEIPF